MSFLTKCGFVEYTRRHFFRLALLCVQVSPFFLAFDYLNWRKGIGLCVFLAFVSHHASVNVRPGSPAYRQVHIVAILNISDYPLTALYVAWENA